MKYTNLTAQARRIMRRVQIHTRRMLSGMLIGDSRSARKGTGMELDQIREYRIGDDTRFIDWNASARYNELLIKECFEERSRTVILCVDVSSSVDFGSSACSKRERIAEVAGTLALMAEYGRDRVGLVLFAGDIEKVIPPRRGFRHIHAIIEQLLAHRAQTKGTNLGAVFEWLSHYRPSGAVSFVISDFIDDDQALVRYIPVAARRHEVIAVRILDERERSMPVNALVTMEDPETGELVLIDTRAAGGLETFLSHRVSEQDQLLKRHKIDAIDIVPSKPFAADVIQCFRRRMRY